jgi:hypothetical protein
MTGWTGSRRKRDRRRTAIGAAVVIVGLITGGVIGALAANRPAPAGSAALIEASQGPSSGPLVAPSAAPTLTPTSAATPTALPVPTVTPPPTASPESTATPIAGDAEIGRLVFSLAPWSDIVTPYTMSLTEDGRLTTIRLGGAAGALSQRRLTPDGVERVRQEITATGLLDESAFYGPIPRPGHELPGRGNSGFRMELGINEWTVQVSWVVVTEDEVEWAEPSPERERLDALGERLMSIESWLPASAWAQVDPGPYVPARHRLFTTAQPWGGEPADLPPDVLDVAWPLEGTPLTVGQETESSSPNYTIRCTVVEATEAQAVVDALAAAGAPVAVPLGSASAVGTQLGDRSTTRIVAVTLAALHPHETSCQDAHPPF